MRSGCIPGGKIGLLRWVVQENPVKRIVRIVGEHGGGRLGDAAAVDDQEVGERISPPQGVLAEVVGRLDLVSDASRVHETSCSSDTCCEITTT